jgi:taurine--2-oxoglutarate transaminase
MTELMTACKDRGLLPLIAGNRVHVVPPCTVSEAEAKEGITLLDDALSVVDRHCGGRSREAS